MGDEAAAAWCGPGQSGTLQPMCCRVKLYQAGSTATGSLKGAMTVQEAGRVEHDAPGQGACTRVRSCAVQMCELLVG